MTDLYRGPKIVGRYALYDRLAVGGMAAVHVGRLLGEVGFARTVAIKRLHAQYAQDPEFTSMFLDEARIVARIQHPNVVPTLDVVSVEDELFIVMEYVRGESLARLLRVDKAVPVETIVSVMVGALHGLHAAHEARSERGELLNIVHRDVSPQNIMVGVDGVPRVLDFGIAKAIGRLQTTRDGSVKGKLSYMAPEQIRGAASRRSDVYAAAIVLWEGLTGQPLFAGEVEGEILHKVLAGCSQSPSALRPEVPAWLDEVVMRGLAPSPDQRFATAHEMARALEDGMPMQAASKIGEWVRQTGGEKLAEREVRVAAIERDSQGTPGPERAPVSQPGAVPGAGRSTGAQPPPVPLVPEELTTPMSSGSVSIARRPTPSSSRPALIGAIAGAGVVAVGMALALTFGGLGSRSAAETARPEASEPRAASSAPIVEASAAATAALVMPASASAPSVSPSIAGSGSPASEPAPPATASASAPAAKRPAGPSTPKAKPNCNPPYYYDARKVRVFKTECL